MRPLLRLLLLLLCLAAPAAALAQAESGDSPEVTEFGLESWDPFSDLVDLLLEDPNTPTARLEVLREDLVKWRAWLLEAQDADKRRVETIRAQIQGLGPEPNVEAGEVEPDGIANRRADLERELAEALSPGLRAAEGYGEADGLIAQIDSLIRKRQTEAFLEIGPSPVLPKNWGAALVGLTGFTRNALNEVERELALPWRQAELRRSAPLTFGLIALALLLLARGRSWMTRLTGWVQSRVRARGRIALGFLVSLGQILVPFLGVGLLASALLSTDILESRGHVLLRGLVVLVLSSFSALWLMGRLFPVAQEIPTPFRVDEIYKGQARRRGFLIGVLIGLALLLRDMTQFDEIDRAVEAVVAMPIFLSMSASYYVMARTLRAATHESGGNENTGFSLGILRVLGRALVVVAAVGPLIAAVGYHNLADAIMMPTALTVALLGLLLALQAPIRDLYAWATKTSLQDAGEALIPVLINFFLVFAALPVLALIWGARPAELMELYAQINEGVVVGGTRLTPGAVLGVIVVFAVGLAATRLFQGALKGSVLPRTHLDVGARNAVVSFAGYAGIALSVTIAANAGGFDFTALAVIAGALSVGIGFGLQNIVQNFISGIILLIERPISEGDWIEVGNQMGIVKNISVRSTTIETFDKQQVIVPNGDFISGSVTNWTRGNQIGRAIVSVGVAYGTDTRRVEQILHEVVKGVDHVAHYPPPAVDFMGFGADSLDFRIRAILTDVTKLLPVKTELHHRIAERFAAEGVEIPFAQRDIWLRNPEVLQPRPPSTEAGVPADPPEIGTEGTKNMGRDSD